MVTDNTQDRIEEVNHPDQEGLDIQHTGNRAAVGATDHARHGLDDNADHDPEKGAAIGGLGGAAVGAAAGSIRRAGRHHHRRRRGRIGRRGRFGCGSRCH